MRQTPTARAAAAREKAAPTLTCSTSTPAISGPISVPTLSTVDVAAFAATSSSGVAVNDGSKAWRVGLISVEEIPTSAAHTRTPVSEPAKAATAEQARENAPSSIAASRSRSRRNRSPSEAAPGAMTAAGKSRISPARPTAVAPPASYANTPSATKYAHSALIAAPHASSTYLTFSFLPASAAAASLLRRGDTLAIERLLAALDKRERGPGLGPGPHFASPDVLRVEEGLVEPVLVEQG